MYPFFSNDERLVRNLLDLVHFDVCVPMSTPYIMEFSYFVIFIDDDNRKCRIYFMKQKNEVFERFREFKSFVGKKTWHKILEK